MSAPTYSSDFLRRKEKLLDKKANLKKQLKILGRCPFFANSAKTEQKKTKKSK